MVSEEERFRTVERGDYYVILPVLPELRDETENTVVLESEYSSRDGNLTGEALRSLLENSSDEIKRFLSPH
jgi:hypothetical protein